MPETPPPAPSAPPPSAPPPSAPPPGASAPEAGSGGALAARTPERLAREPPITSPGGPLRRAKSKPPCRMAEAVVESSAAGSTPRTVTTWFKDAASGEVSSAFPSTYGVAETTPGAPEASATRLSGSSSPRPPTASMRTWGSTLTRRSRTTS